MLKKKNMRKSAEASVSVSTVSLAARYESREVVFR